jgi:brassinosteroid-6-oxidase 2
MAFLSSLKQIAGMETSSISQPFMTEFFKLVIGTLSLPINLPGTNYHNGLQVYKVKALRLFQLVPKHVLG